MLPCLTLRLGLLPQPEQSEVLVIGASLSGLTFALACAHRKIRTRLLERVIGGERGGGALGINRDLLMRVVGLNPRDVEQVAAFPNLLGNRKAATWQATYNWLRHQVFQHPEIAVSDGITASQVLQGDDVATVLTSDGQRIDAPVIVGADGYRSVVRCAISPEAQAAYAGYLLWRGLISERELPPSTRLPPNGDGGGLITKSGHRLVAYPVASPNGSLAPGERLLCFAWYDPTRNNLLLERGGISASRQVLSSLRSDNIPPHVWDELIDLARRIWPEPWQAIIVCALLRREVFAMPIAEYYPARLHSGRLAVIGDAAHLVSPVTGEGFLAGILDAEALADSLASPRNGKSEVVPMLKAYEEQRLRAVQDLVRSSMTWSRAYVQKYQNNM